MPRISSNPYWQTTDGSVKLYLGDVIERLRNLPSRSVQTVITSPPYFNQRDYGGDSREIGSEETPEEYVARLVAVFEEVKRVLRVDGTVWLNLGDKSSSGKSGRDDSGDNGAFGGPRIEPRNTRVKGIRPGNILGMPWRVAFGLQSAGWILRSEIIWYKPDPMPESVTNRPTRAHEQVFLLAQSQDYYYDIDAIREPAAESSAGRYKYSFDNKTEKGEQRVEAGNNLAWNGGLRESTGLANKRSVWRITKEGYAGAHFAPFPQKLVEPCLFAGTSSMGACVQCGAPHRRVTKEETLKRKRPNDYTKRTGEEGTGNSCANSVAGVSVKTIGWESTCDCYGISAGEVKPCVVLDPFIGSGTTAVVSLAHGRHCIGIDLSEVYLRDNAIPRIEGALLSRPELASLAGRKAERVEIGEEITEE